MHVPVYFAHMTVHVVKMYGCVSYTNGCVCACLNYSQGSDDKPGGGTQVLIVVVHVLDPLKVQGTRHLRT